MDLHKDQRARVSRALQNALEIAEKAFEAELKETPSPSFNSEAQLLNYYSFGKNYFANLKRLAPNENRLVGFQHEKMIRVEDRQALREDERDIYSNQH